jgi:NAD(P)-dependent dehydrogenase (short-subunit alcohol dehydrogenase family)
MVSAAKQTIAIVGGSGALGFGLALRWGQAGHDITASLVADLLHPVQNDPIKRRRRKLD